jgi:RNA polymerase sigma-70 factor (ECF subfamily)
VSEKEFIDNIKASQATINKLVNLYADDSELRKDLYQEILLNAWRGCHLFRGQSSFNTWIYRVSINTIFTHKRKERGAENPKTRAELKDFHSVASNHSDEAQHLRAAIKQLNESDRIIIQMHLDGYNNFEMADILGISDNHVAVKLHRIRHQLAKFLKPKNQEIDLKNK